ncbi:hypothetical protein TBLA_0C03520 [Henningerozyma blattae CBS 6284]|uniref:Rad4 beta-hairpin domain-containing protein n=1 Tax=Henningerozyma blattae (strain ATCC 34711 / CBS 6284 / DSM 70876 / NBRC 10599 / NRRL Y-10934 / UCD 77-7) TaxID=1071380 RepID=I2H1A2_HENB6|nr:hypothetical protein TBLA_0C03520 [Tetrapisispora blattae CBS 6284]CCH60154.1 hypothetical protein TBLA_0C03520 [Tetrapisispora blattae CBS 6284]
MTKRSLKGSNVNRDKIKKSKTTIESQSKPIFQLEGKFESYDNNDDDNNDDYVYYESESASDTEGEDSIDWQDVILENVVKVTYENPKPIPTKEKTQLKQYKKLKYCLNIFLIPFFLRVLRQRSHWTKDARLNRRLKRSIPKLIAKKFSIWIKKRKSLTPNEHGKKTLTCLIGLVMWFRSHYQINSNGFRQNFIRYQYLIKYVQDKTVKDYSKINKHILNDQHQFYGSRPEILEGIEDIRKMAKNKKTNRDILVIFFIIILKNLIPESNRLKIVLCFALPLHDFKISCSDPFMEIVKKRHGYVPNKFDTDLLQPNFWIELYLSEDSLQYFYVIDPVIHVQNGKDVVVKKYQVNEFVNGFEPNIQLDNNLTQTFTTVIGIDIDTNNIKNITSRYVKNVNYQFFNEEFLNTSQSLTIRKYNFLQSQLKIFNRVPKSTKHYNLMKQISDKNYTLPKNIKEMKASDNFIIPSLLKQRQVMKPASNSIGSFSYRIANTDMIKKEPVYWKSDILHLKSEQHWNILGRTLKTGSTPLKSIILKPKGENKLPINDSPIRYLYAFEQTIKTRQLPSTYKTSTGEDCKIMDVNFYKNKYGNVEIFHRDTLPQGFKLIKITPFLKPSIHSYNKQSSRYTSHSRIRYLDVVSGFDFKQKNGFATPVIKNIMVNDHDEAIVKRLEYLEAQTSTLDEWATLLKMLQIKDHLDGSYGSLAKD